MSPKGRGSGGGGPVTGEDGRGGEGGGDWEGDENGSKDEDLEGGKKAEWRSESSSSWFLQCRSCCNFSRRRRS